MHAVLTDAELEESINILLDDESAENLSTNLVATNLVPVLVLVLEPSAEAGPS